MVCARNIYSGSFEFICRGPYDGICFSVYTVTEFVPFAVRYLKLLSGALAFFEAVLHARWGPVITGAYDDIVFCNYRSVPPPKTGGTRGHRLCYIDEIFVPSGSCLFLRFFSGHKFKPSFIKYQGKHYN